MNNKNDVQHKKPRFQPIGLIFYCYLFLPVGRQGYLSMS